MEELKRVYSLNLAAYLIQKGYTYQIGFDEESARFYFVFDPSDKLKNDISLYKNTDVQVSLKGFTKAYKKLRDEIRDIRFSEEFGIKYAMCKIRALGKRINNERVDEDE